MTPSRLSVRRPTATGEGLTKYKFAVRAEFDDGVVADITDTQRYNADAGDAEFFHVNHQIRIPPAAGAGTVRTISIATTPEWNSRRAHADIAVLEPWASEPNVPQAELVDGPPGVWDGTLKPEKLANVVLVGTGFRPLDLAAFQDMTNDLVHRMRTRRHLTPYNHLANSMNYWRLFVPASEAGVSVRCEVYSFLDPDNDALRVALRLPQPVKPAETATTKDWTEENLLYMAGLPVAADLNLVLDKTQNPPRPPASIDDFRRIDPANVDFSPLRAKWAAIMPDTPAHDNLDALTPQRMRDWLVMANRTFIDEVDNFPNVAIGDPPSISPAFDQSGPLAFNARRGIAGADIFGPTIERNAELRAFFRRVTAAPRNGITTTLGDSQFPQVGNLWAEDRQAYAFDNRDFVVAFPNMPIRRTPSGRFFGRSQTIHTEAVFARPTLEFIDPPNNLPGLPVAQAAGRNALTLAAPPLSAMRALPETWEVIAHELGHAFGLGDEYPLGGNFSFGSFPEPNLMAPNAVLNADKTVRISQIKWNWHRVRKASVITRPIHDLNNGTFRVFVAKGSGFQFRGESVRLRKREPRQRIGFDPPTSNVEFAVESVHADNLDDSQDTLNMTVVIKNVSIGIDVDPFKPGSLIYVPTRAPGPAPGIDGPILTIVSPAAERIMAAIGGPMNGKDCDAADPALADHVQVPRLPIDQLPTFAPLSTMTTIVGVYHGGGQMGCDAMHPAGSCFMRTGIDGITVFCQVCRFALVDLIDPEQHQRIDRDYDEEYTL
jgi:IgA Peptidase M64